MTWIENTLVQDLVTGKLHEAANEATRKSGWGRIKNLDGTFQDTTPHGGGIVRTVLDKFEVDGWSCWSLVDMD